MTIKELKNILDNFNDNDNVVIAKDVYACGIDDNIDKRKITSAFEKDFEAVVIATNNQLKGCQISWKKYK